MVDHHRYHGEAADGVDGQRPEHLERERSDLPGAPVRRRVVPVTSGAAGAFGQPAWRRRSAALVVLSLLLGFLTATTGARVQPAEAAGALTNRWTFDAAGSPSVDSVVRSRSRLR